MYVADSAVTDKNLYTDTQTDYSGTSEQRTHWERNHCPLLGGCPYLGGSH